MAIGSGQGIVELFVSMAVIVGAGWLLSSKADELNNSFNRFSPQSRQRNAVVNQGQQLHIDC